MNLSVQPEISGKATTFREFDIKKIRNDFPVLHREVNGNPLVYLDNGASSQKPKQVIERMARYYEYEHANIHRGVHHLSQRATDAYEQVREATCNYLNAESSREILFTRGTTESINLVACSWGRHFLSEGDEIIVSTMEHHSNIVPWQMVCEEREAKLKVIPISIEGELDMEAFQNLLSERTRLVSLVHVSNALGTINPVQEIIRLAHQYDALVLLDGAQALPHMKVDVRAMDVDFYAFSAHKMLGPTGLGVLYGKESLLDSMPPYQGGGEMIQRVTFEKTIYNELPFKFEAGTPNIADTIAFGSALEYYDAFDQSELTAHEQGLLAYASKQLSQIDSIEFVGTANDKAGVISFNLKNVHPFDVGTILDQMGIAVRTGHHCTQPLMDFYGITGTVRASFAFYNNQDDIDALIGGVEKASAILL